MKEKGKRQKGAQRHAEGTHGEVTRRAIREQINSGSRHEEPSQSDPVEPKLGRHKIHEDREQHDEADKNSEKNRLARDIQMRGAEDLRERSS